MRISPRSRQLKSGQSRASQSGSVLLEGMIAILVFSMGVLAIVGLQAASMKTVSDAKYRLEASYLANRLISNIWAAGTSGISGFSLPGGDSPELATWLVEVGNRLPGADTHAPTVLITGDASAGFTATVTMNWQLPAETELHQYVAVAFINTNTTP